MRFIFNLTKPRSASISSIFVCLFERESFFFIDENMVMAVTILSSVPSSTRPSSSSSSSMQSIPINTNQQSIGQWQFSAITILLFSILLLFGCGFSPSLQISFAPKLITRFCYNSPNLSTINSQCVLCNYYMFDATVLGCTGSTALTMNITATQAFCVISQCLGQVRQQPVFLGRRKRDSSNDSPSMMIDSNVLKNSTISTSPADEYRIEKEIEADIVPDDDLDDDNDSIDNDDGYEIQ
uniref:Uncharacterized protein LOC113794911 n=1 Tax=Dermatophagoides pteronyssinus TaxID=6956 RepID=A0A6P6Y624_DERPT|nr:uncharacterized protein LOC113794911 [Dermatophagoides pteronyssinus]